ncbi:MAG: class I SAM-dependent methyltransferase [Lachnospiraceae bacterium]|nr:class I SAM-dependent methyltransferase [Lachnospiraceae bacterium]
MRHRIADLEGGYIKVNSTINYYNNNAKEFCEGTLQVDMSLCRNMFLKYMRPNGYILDAGCGSGRDSKVFQELGYEVTGFDASEEICRFATEYLGQEVQCRRFEDVTEENCYDGIWASASLLHVSKKDMPDVLARLKRALKADGILYASFKYGETEKMRGERSFSDFTEEQAKQLFLENGFEVLEFALTGDVRDGRADEMWCNVVVKK